MRCNSALCPAEFEEEWAKLLQFTTDGSAERAYLLKVHNTRDHWCLGLHGKLLFDAATKSSGRSEGVNCMAKVDLVTRDSLLTEVRHLGDGVMCRMQKAQVRSGFSLYLAPFLC
jgi:hypothetical protein